MRLTTHSDKFRDVLRLEWDQDSLLRVLVERIRHAFKVDATINEKFLLFQVFPEKVGSQYTVNWMADRTLRRPRELLQLARLYTEELVDNEPSDKILKGVEEVYSGWKKDDLCSEFIHQYPGLIKIFEFWRNRFFRTKYHLQEKEFFERLSRILKEVQIDSEWFTSLKSPEGERELAKILFAIGFIGDFVKGGDGGSRVDYFSAGAEPLFKEVQVHPCFRKAVSTVERMHKSRGSSDSDDASDNEPVTLWEAEEVSQPETAQILPQENNF